MEQMGVCVDPTKKSALGIADKVKRSFGVGTTQLAAREAARREKRRERFLSEIQEVSPQFRDHVLPGLGPHEGFPVEEQKVVLVSEEDLKVLVEKIVKGAEYVLNDRRYVEPPYRIEMSVPKEEVVQRLEAERCAAAAYELGPGFCIARFRDKKDPLEAMYHMEIWGALAVCGIVLSD